MTPRDQRSAHEASVLVLEPIDTGTSVAVPRAPHTASAGTSVLGRLHPQLVLPFLGIGSWAFGVSRLRLSTFTSYGILASANVWFVLGFLALLAGFLLELRRDEPRSWLLGLTLIGLIVAIHASVPIISGAPEYPWVYKHIGVAAAFQHYGHVTDPTNIYQQWPALFSAVAAVSTLAHVGPLSFAAWAPLAFELADALLLLAIFRQLTADRRVPYLGVLLYTGLISWVGQDYLSPQAFAYTLWLGLALIITRWLRAPAPRAPGGRSARLRAPLIAGLPPIPAGTRGMRAVAVTLVVVIYTAIVVAHQLTPYMVLAGVGALTVLDVIRPRWLLLLLALIAGGYLADHYQLIAHDFGGLFSGGDPITNASGSAGTHHAGAQATTALIVRTLAASMWILALAAILRRHRTLGRVAIPGALAFSPFLILGAQSYGGEAIYRVYLFSAPWCALLIADGLCELRPRLRWPLVGAVCVTSLFAGLQGLYGPVVVNAFTPAEVNASRWLYSHVPRGSLIVLPVDNFPALETANYNDYEIQVMPADPQLGEAWMDESNVPEVKRWIADLGHPTAYLVLSRSMSASASYYGAPTGYEKLVHALPSASGGAVVYDNGDTTIYRLGRS